MKPASLFRRHRSSARGVASAVALALASLSTSGTAQQQSVEPTVSISWDRIVGESKTAPSMQMAVQPPFRPQSPLHKPIYDSIRGLDAKYIRWVPWLAQPRLAVAELSPPTAKGTSWDFRELDGITIPFLEATKGREPVINFSVIPRWMFKTKFNVDVPADPDKLVWNYSNITGVPFSGGGLPVELTDPSGKQVGAYYARLVSWYTKGGFTDENGVYHRSGYYYSFPWWEVLSELDNGEDIQLYTKLYDSIATSIKKVSPATKFIGFSANCGPGSTECSPEYLEYFLDPKNHAPGVPIDRVSYHAYVMPAKGQTADQWQYSLFEQADWFLEWVKFAEATRRRLRPTAGVDINEIGCILPEDGEDFMRGLQGQPPAKWEVPEIYWNACGAYYAYMFTGLTRLGIDVAKASQLFGYNGQFASVSLLDPRTGLPNARYRVLALIVANFRPGDKLVQTTTDWFGRDVSAQAFNTSAGKRVLLVNKRNRSIDLAVKSDANVSSIDVVDSRSAGQSPRSEAVRDGKIHLGPFAVAVASFE
jgi:hypothetical protein